MANIFVRSTDGDNASDGSTWALAKATIAGALAIAIAGDTIYVSKNHAETQASALTWTSPGTIGNPVLILCVDDTGDPVNPTALATTATVTTTGNSTTAFGAGYAYVYGIQFTSGSGGNSSATISFTVAGSWWKLERCKLYLATTQNAGKISTGVGGSTQNDNSVEWVDVDVQFNHTGQGINANGKLKWCGGTVVGAVFPTYLFYTTGTGKGAIDVSGVDLSAIGTGRYLINWSLASVTQIDFRNCKLGSGVTVTSEQPRRMGSIRVVNCDSADTNYQYELQAYQGGVCDETTIVRTGGASDGTTPVSRKMVTTANSKFFAPLESDPIAIWNETVAAPITVQVPVINDGITLTDKDVFIEVEYLGTSGFPLSSIASNRPDILASAEDLPADASAWTTTGLSSPVKQMLGVTITPQEKGWIQVRVCLARPSTTLWFDPKVQVS
jgi:hypothetical protein